MSATIKDVARLAGVGVGTASRVISGRGSVAPDTAARVQQAIQTLGFRPSSIARALSTRSLDLIGILVPGFEGLFYGPVLDAVSQQLRDVGRHMVASNGSSQGDARADARGNALSALALMRQRDCDGLIFVCNEYSDADLRGLHSSQPNIAIVNRVVPGLEAVCFSSDHVLGGRLAAECLLAHGHRQIAVVSGSRRAPDNEDRLRGFFEALDSAGVPVPAEAITHGNFMPDSGQRCAHTLLARRAALGFTAVFCANDAMAMGLISAFHAAGVRVPEDVSVVGYDDCQFAEQTSPPLTTVRQPIHHVARQATRDLVNRCYGLALSVQRDFAPVLVQRASVRQVGPSLLAAVRPATARPAASPAAAPTAAPAAAHPTTPPATRGSRARRATARTTSAEP